MKTLRSFVTALIIFILFLSGMNVGCSKMSLKTDNREFGLWYNVYKNRSFDLLADNLGPDTILLMGSSEFSYGRYTIYHPRNLFRNSEIDLLSIGGPYNQILFHLIALGSLEPKLESRKAVLLISPSWFKRKGVNDRDYMLRFSETQYISFMENTRIPKEIRQYATRRSETLMKNNPSQLKKINIINKALLEGDNKLISLCYRAEKHYAFHKDRITAGFVLFSSGMKWKNEKSVRPSSEEIDWEKLEQRAADDSRLFSNNPFDMNDRYWQKDILPVYEKMKGSLKDTHYDVSPEFQDLEYFLKMCQAVDLQCKLIVLPVNGKWFDYTGRIQEKRQMIGDEVMRLATQYGAESAILSDYDYEPYITVDAVHPWNKGWLKINEEVYQFYLE